MIGRLLCWLGWHDWPNYWRVTTGDRRYKYCRRCRKEKIDYRAIGNC